MLNFAAPITRQKEPRHSRTRLPILAEPTSQYPSSKPIKVRRVPDLASIRASSDGAASIDARSRSTGSRPGEAQRSRKDDILSARTIHRRPSRDAEAPSRGGLTTEERGRCAHRTSHRADDGAGPPQQAIRRRSRWTMDSPGSVAGWGVSSAMRCPILLGGEGSHGTDRAK